METAAEITIKRLTPKSSAPRDAERRKKHGRTRITNGNQLLPSVSGASLWARLMRDTYLALIDQHLSGMASETQQLICRRIAVLEAELIHLEDRFAVIRAEGGEPDMAHLDLYGRLADRQRRLADPLGWSRTPHDVTPSLSDLLREEHSARQEVDHGG
jgi:hypothetical protein